MIESLLPKGTARLWTAVLSILLAFAIGAVMIVVNGDNPIVAYSTMIESSLGSVSNLAATLAVATPAYFYRTFGGCGLSYRLG